MTGENPKGTVISEAELASATDAKSVRRSKGSAFIVGYRCKVREEVKELSLYCWVFLFFSKLKRNPRSVTWTSSQRESKSLRVSGEASSGYQLLHPWIHEGKVLEHVLVHAVDQRSVCKWQPGLFIQEFFVEIAAVVRWFLDQRLRGGEKKRGKSATEFMIYSRHGFCHLGSNLHKKTLAPANQRK